MIIRTANIFICCLFLQLSVFGQDRVRDSLNHLVATGHDTIKVQALNKISRLLVGNLPDSAFVMSDSALTIATRSHYEAGKGFSYLSMGSAQTTSGKYDEAIINLLKGLNILEKLKQYKAVTNGYNTLANTYLGLKNDDKAYQYYLKSHTMAKQEPRNDFMVAVTSVGLGGILLGKKKFEEAIGYYQAAEIYFGEKGNFNYQAMATSMIGESYLKSGDFFKAEKYFRKALAVFRNEKDDYGLASVLDNLGGLEVKRKNYGQAITYFKESLELNIQRNALDNIQSTALNLSEALEYEKQPAEALRYFKIYMQYKDSVVNVSRDRAVADAESRYESKKKEDELLIKNIELEKSQLQVTQRNRLIYIFAGAILLVIVLLFFVYLQFSAKRKANLLLLSKNEEVQRQKFIIEEKNKDITDSINYSRHIQQAILPTPQMVSDLFPQSFVIFKPKDIVSGDFYLLERNGDCIYLAVVDCTGHGVPGAMLSVFAHSALKNIIATGNYQHNPAGVLKELCEQFRLNLQSGTSMAMSDGVDMGLCILHRSKNILYFAGAKNELVRIKNGVRDEFDGNRYGISGRNIGIQTEFTDFVIDVEKGDRYYLFTDGFADQFGGPQGKKFMKKQLKDALLQHTALSFAAQKNVLKGAFENWKDGLEQLDDVTLIGFGT